MEILAVMHCAMPKRLRSYRIGIAQRYSLPAWLKLASFKDCRSLARIARVPGSAPIMLASASSVCLSGRRASSPGVTPGGYPGISQTRTPPRPNQIPAGI